MNILLTILIGIFAFVCAAAAGIEIMHPGFFKDLMYHYIPPWDRKEIDKYNKSISEKKQIEKDCRVNIEYADYLQKRGNETLVNEETENNDLNIEVVNYTKKTPWFFRKKGKFL